MNLRDVRRQSVLGLFTVKRRIVALAVAMLALALGSLVYVNTREPKPAPTARTPRLSAKHERAALVASSHEGTLSARPAWLDNPNGPGAEPVTTESRIGRKTSEAQPSLADLESQFRSTYNKKEKTDLLRVIAGWNNRGAVAVLSRVFRSERLPESRQAVLIALGDIDPAEGLQERLTLLSEATQRQPREIRITALDLLESVDDPQSTKLIERVMRTDPDREVRDAAKVLYDTKAGAHQ